MSDLERSPIAMESPHAIDTSPSFPKFTKLPAELRLRIWECTIEPRLVGIRAGPLAVTVLDSYRNQFGWENGLPLYKLEDIAQEIEENIEKVISKWSLSYSDGQKLRDEICTGLGSLKVPERETSFSSDFYVTRADVAIALLGSTTQEMMMNYLRSLLGVSSAVELEILINYSPNKIPSRFYYGSVEPQGGEFDPCETSLKEPLFSIRSNSPSPMLLSVCRESRTVALKRYTRAFITYKESEGVYFDFKNDILFIRFTQVLRASVVDLYGDDLETIMCTRLMKTLNKGLESKNLQLVENVALLIDPDCYGEDEYSQDHRCRSVAHLLIQFPGMKKCSLVYTHLFELNEGPSGHKFDPCYLIDLLDVESTFDSYRRFDPPPSKEAIFPKVMYEEEKQLAIDGNEVMKQIKRFCLDEGNDPPETAPILEYKTAVTPAVMAGLRGAKVECERVFAEYVKARREWLFVQSGVVG